MGKMFEGGAFVGGNNDDVSMLNIGFSNVDGAYVVAFKVMYIRAIVQT